MDNQELIKYNLEKCKENKEERNTEFQDLGVILIILFFVLLWIGIPLVGGGLIGVLLHHIWV